MKKTLLLSIVLWGTWMAAFAQVVPVNPANTPLGVAPGGPISGTVRDSVTNRSLEKAVISYVEAGKTDTSRFLSDPQGHFTIDRTPAGDFILIISFIGHQTKGIRYPANMAGDLGVIPLSEQVKEIAEVIIQAPPIKVMQDTVEYRANAYPVRKDAVAEDLLKKLPGVEVDAAGNVTAHGQTVTKIKVNGKDFFGGDPKMATKNIPADAIDKIQVIDDQSDQAKFSGFDDGDRTKIINITIKKDRNQGYFGSATLGIGSATGGTQGTATSTGDGNSNRYEAYLRAFRFNNNEQMAVLGNANNINLSTFTQGGANFQGGGGRGGGGGGGTTSASGNLTSSNPNATGYNDAKTAGFNYANDIGSHFTIYGSYQYTETKSTVLTSSYTHFLSPGYPIPYNTSQGNSYTDQKKHSVLLNIGLGITKHDSLLFRGSFNYSSNLQNTSTQTASQDSAMDPSATLNQGYHGLNTSPAVNASLLWMHRFNKVGRTLSVTVTDNPSPQTETDTNFSVQQSNLTGGGPMLTDTIHQVSYFKVNNYAYSARASYTEPLSKKSGLEMSYAYSSSENVSNKNVYGLNPDLIKTYVDSLSNNLDNTLITNKIGLTFRHKERKFNYQIGAALQPTELNTRTIINDSLRVFDQKEVEIVPIGSLAYQFSTTKRLRIFYTGTSQQPSPNQLQPVPDISNQQLVNLGNPNLKPEFDNHIVINYNNFDNLSGRSFFLNLNANIVNKNIATNTITSDSSVTQYSQPINVDGYYTVSGNANFSQPFHNREFILTLASKLNYVNNVGEINGVRNVGRNWVPTETMRFEMDRGDWLELIAGASYNLNATNYTLSQAQGGGQNTQTGAWALAQSSRVDFLKIFSFRYDFTYTINQGYSSSIGNKSIALVNAVLETRFFDQKGVLALSVNDLFNTNTSFAESSLPTKYTESQTNILQRFFMLTFTYKFSKFKGAAATGGGMMGRGMRRDGGFGGGRPGGGGPE